MITFDIEANNLLNNETIDYLASPFKLKDTFELHCIVIEDHESGDIIAFYDGMKYELDGRTYTEFDTKHKVTYVLENYEPIQYIHKQLSQFRDYIKARKPHSVIGHNIINYDLLVTKLIYGMNYTVYPDTWDGLDVTIEDTLVFSKKLNPDRFGGHSLDNLSTKVGLRKIDFRPDIDKALKFKAFAADMLYYCIRDVKVNTLVFKYLQKEAGGWDWKDAIDLEKAVAEIVTRQEHRGFKFDKNLAESNIKELDSLMDERSTRVTPVIPNKPATKKFMSDYTPPVRQILKNGQPTSYLLKFVDKIGATLSGDVGEYKLTFNGISYDVPLPLEVPLLTEQEAGINDTTHIKEWIVREFGWNPSEYKEKDITVDSKKIKLSPEKLEATIDRYVDQTLNSAFCKDRCEFLKTSPKKLRDTLIKRCESGRGVKVLTNPNFTKGQEKEICPDLERIADKFPFAKDVVEYLTYKHRRNSILGGGLEWDDEEEAEKGYMSYIRDDGRIATPADTCGCATSRFKHKVVANIPRTTSLYGRKMRELFGVDEGFIQFGYDFDSLEARIESHYCYKYDPTKEYCNALILEKPNDVHSMMARRITEVISRKFERGSAKSVKYGITYGATAPKVAKIIGESEYVGELVYNAFWEAAFPLAALKSALMKYWETIAKKLFVLGIDGSKVVTRSPHALLNSLFQSAGVLCAKRAMVIHDRKLKEEGYSVDFFVDDWKNKKFCQQLIAYHDEAQGEISRELVRIKVFETEEEAVLWKDATQESKGIILSDIGHMNDKFIVGYSRPAELAVIAVKEASDYYKLNVDLTAGYILGKNWGDCH